MMCRMAKLQALTPAEERFFDAGDDGEPRPSPDQKARYEFTRHLEGRHEGFKLRRRIGYRRRPQPSLSKKTEPSTKETEPSSTKGIEYVVPKDLKVWHTDFASIPALFGWLVPRSGDHLPAAVLHDALVQGQRSYVGPPVTRDEADAIFKEAMGDLGTAVVRRWLIWTAVTLATLVTWQFGSAMSWRRAYYGLVPSGILLAIFTLGVCATFNVLALVDWPFQAYADRWWKAPWMQSSDFWVLIRMGFAGAVVLPSLLAPLWGRFWQAGLIAGISLAALLHVSLLLLLLTAFYMILERLARLRRGQVVLALLLVAWVAIAAYFFTTPWQRPTS